MRLFIKSVAGLLLLGSLSACGTTFQLPELGELQTQQAAKMFAEARSERPRAAISTAAAEQRFRRVASRISPVGKKYCEIATADQKDFNCNVDIGIDRKMNNRNAYFTYDGDNPTIRITVPMLRDTRSDDEVAFILAHEYGHLVGRHIEKQQQQMIAGALILGAMGAAANSYNVSNGGYYDPTLVDNSMKVGAAIGSRAYSQTYELESDTLGTRIAAAAGYDPVEGAKFFARPEDAKSQTGNLSFWGTHPPNEKRLATVLATVDEIKSNVGLRLAKKSSD